MADRKTKEMYKFNECIILDVKKGQFVDGENNRPRQYFEGGKQVVASWEPYEITTKW